MTDRTAPAAPPPRLGSDAARVETRLAQWLRDDVRQGEIDRPARLMAAMRHGALDGGKRLRPHLVMEACRACGGDAETALDVACALETVHCYSLIHDDLPAMDDDDLRRGRPTVHVAFDEATAILAGDALLTLAFERIAEDARLGAEIRLELTVLLARAAGLGGMIGGQMHDIAAENAGAPLDEASVRRLQAMKTGALIAFACEAGAIVAGAPDAVRRSLGRFGRGIGLAFQIADDLLDATASAEAMGKATAKDATAGKATLVSLHGIDGARRLLREAVDTALACLDGIGDENGASARADGLRAIARFVAMRRN